MGIDKIAFYEDMVGFGHKTGVDLPHEMEGVAPSERWKLRTQRDKWYAGDTISVSIGQGFLTVTPIQLARAIGGLAMGGVWRQPHLVKDPGWKDKPVEWQLAAQNVKDVIDGMCGVVNEAGATGVRAQLPGIEVCGKTGTAQVASEEYVKSKKGSESLQNLKDNAWFVGFAPGRAPEVVVVALFEHGAESKFAAPIVRDVIKAYFDKKTRLTNLQQQRDELAALWGGPPGLPSSLLPARQAGVPAKKAGGPTNVAGTPARPTEN
jgi:penicillin-binding protein 2